ncbi:hypothetical protein AB7849_03170 [Rhodanobacter sp. 115]|uniref:hypothetical protein n=1 Tax=Rhodanobacter sp. FW021-MT20 TaxID=1162282 RepID=UPI000260F8F3|nr:hypothetical protein [Rhodanobacter sp. 115]EIL87441.1 hypothetical protein UU5_18792 [Rhodanobacter sp. 115]
MKTDFVQPRFTGLRFDEHTLPVDVARDLAAYESLIVDLAKHLYLQEHPDRQRVPKGFSSNFHLDIEKIDPGSARPLLALVISGMLALTGGESSYFERARDLVAECVAAPVTALPAQFPKDLLSHFNQFGRSLREDETLELPRAGGTVGVLTPGKRKDLVLAAEQYYERDVDLAGSIVEADWEKSTFRLRLEDGGHTIVPMPESFHSRAREFGGRNRHQVQVKGVATYDSWDRLQRVVSVESLDVTKNYPLAMRFDDLIQLKDGWYEGQGIAPDRDKLAIVAEKLIGAYPERVQLPLIAPTPNGNLLLEWEAVGDPSVDIDLAEERASFHSFGDRNGEIEMDFPLGTDSDWKSFFAFLSEHIKQQSA